MVAFSQSGKMNVGLGMGIDYGGFGGRFTFLPTEKFGLFAAVGYNLDGAGFNGGALYKFNTEKKVRPYVIAMYGYNGVIRAENADGRSNVSENTGPFINYSMYAVLLDSIKKPAFICSYKSDMKGDFIITVPSGNIGLYPATTKIDSLKPPYNGIPENRNMSGNDSWDVTLPLMISKSEAIKTVNLLHSSVGYAP